MYTIQGDPNHFFLAGIASDNGQVLIVIRIDKAVIMFFDEVGQLIAVKEQPLSEQTATVARELGLDEAFAQGPDSEFQRWLDAIRFRSQPCHVRPFFLSNFNIGIDKYPRHLQSLARESSAESNQIHPETNAELRTWIDEENCVFWLNPYTDLWLNRHGEVIAS
jgi:hypothetical protein